MAFSTIFAKAIQLAFWSSVAGVVVLSLLPTTELPEQVTLVWDKAQHAVGFAFLTALGFLAYPGHRVRVCIGLLLLGAAIEFAQQATGWRQGDAQDWLANAVGIAFTTALWRLVATTPARP
jgi:VanZ family protein